MACFACTFTSWFLVIYIIGCDDTVSAPLCFMCFRTPYCEVAHAMLRVEKAKQQLFNAPASPAPSKSNGSSGEPNVGVLHTARDAVDVGTATTGSNRGIDSTEVTAEKDMKKKRKMAVAVLRAVNTSTTASTEPSSPDKKMVFF